MQALQTLTKPLLLYHRKHTLTRLGISSVLTRLRQTLRMVLTTEHIALRSQLLVCTPSLGVLLFQATTEDNTICWLMAMGIKYYSVSIVTNNMDLLSQSRWRNTTKFGSNAYSTKCIYMATIRHFLDGDFSKYVGCMYTHGSHCSG